MLDRVYDFGIQGFCSAVGNRITYRLYYGRVFSHLIIYFRGMADQKESVQKRDVTRKEQIQTEVFYCTWHSKLEWQNSLSIRSKGENRDENIPFTVNYYKPGRTVFEHYWQNVKKQLHPPISPGRRVLEHLKLEERNSFWMILTCCFCSLLTLNTCIT